MRFLTSTVLFIFLTFSALQAKEPVVPNASPEAKALLKDMFSDVQKVHGKDLPVVMHECSPIPDPDHCFTDGAAYSWWMLWHTNHVTQIDPLELKVEGVQMVDASGHPVALQDAIANDFTGWVRVEGNKFLDPQGNQMLFAGLCASDPDRLETANQWNDRYFGEAANWGANIIRFAVHPQAVRRRGWDAYFEILDRGVELARQHGLYVIMDWHSIGNLKEERFPRQEYITTLDETLQFWKEAARRYKDDPVVAMYEIFNEPTVTRLGECTWEEWRKINEQIIDAIREYNPQALCLVAGFNWAYDLRPVLNDPVQRPNVAYVSHPYPQKREKPWEEAWEADWGHVADKYPVICTEIGFCLENERGAHVPVITDMTYGPEMTSYLKKKGISFTAWCFDPTWAPGLITDWSFTTTTQGTFFRDYLQSNVHLNIEK